ncbi:hypothetical protein PIROE2DRAFT_44329 [Piromyces sp. E2]|nr:hypothetical protein PIROE2DRAFT_44329 [Piromyces sp. E2]|eukprot:OUM62414.1 hypothetical protein PIROE2DRAFT_44329 [Piromyces sp. E2]
MSELSLLHSQFPHLAQWIKLKLDNGEEVEGQIFTYDKISNVVVLQQKCKPENGVEIPGTNPKYNFRIIKISYIKEISIPSAEKETTTSTTEVCPVNIDDIINREKKALKEEFQRQNRIGVGVTEEAQQIFDALSKTMPCSWNNKSIVVMDEVTISPPYNAENCKMVPGKTVQESIIERVQKVLELEKKKIKRK